MKYVYELVDATCDEVNFTKGLFKTLEDAKNYIEEYGLVIAEESSCCDVFKLEVRNREFGYSNSTGSLVYVAEFEQTLNENGDEWEWKLVKKQ